MKAYNLMILFSVMTAISCKQEKIHADLIITNASIYSVDSSMNIAESMAIENGKILAIGNRQIEEGKVISADDAFNRLRETGKIT